MKKEKPLFRRKYHTEWVEELGYVEKIVQTTTFPRYSDLHPSKSIAGMILDNSGYDRKRWLVVVYGRTSRKPYFINQFQRLAEARSWAKKTARSRDKA